MPDEDSLYSTFATFEPGCMISELRCLSILTCVGTRGLRRCCPRFCCPRVMPRQFWQARALRSGAKVGVGGGHNKARGSVQTVHAHVHACTCACAQATDRPGGGRSRGGGRVCLFACRLFISFIPGHDGPPPPAAAG